jgi:hypothetical protein
MPLRIYSCVTYCSTFGGVRTQAHWSALHFAKAIKGTPLAGYAVLPLPIGDRVRVDRRTAHAAPQWFAQLAVHALPFRDFLPIGVVPVPDSECDLACARPPRTIPLADALTSELGADVATVDVLRWARPMAPAHSADGSRDPQVLYGRLRRRDRLCPLAGQRFVLVDDVVATGAHLRAAAAFLSDCGATVAGAICAAYATDSLTPGQDPLAPSRLVAMDFEPDPDWLLPERIDGVEL